MIVAAIALHARRSAGRRSRCRWLALCLVCGMGATPPMGPVIEVPRPEESAAIQFDEGSPRCRTVLAQSPPWPRSRPPPFLPWRQPRRRRRSTPRSGRTRRARRRAESRSTSRPAGHPGAVPGQRDSDAQGRGVGDPRRPDRQAGPPATGPGQSVLVELMQQGRDSQDRRALVGARRQVRRWSASSSPVRTRRDTGSRPETAGIGPSNAATGRPSGG